MSDFPMVGLESHPSLSSGRARFLLAIPRADGPLGSLGDVHDQGTKYIWAPEVVSDGARQMANELVVVSLHWDWVDSKLNE